MESHSLRILCASFGIPDEDILRAESSREFSLECQSTVKQLLAIPDSQYIDAVAGLNQSIEIIVGEKAAPTLEISNESLIFEDSMRGARHVFKGLPSDLVLAVTIIVDKAKLIDSLDVDSGRFSTRLFLFNDNLLSLLSTPLHELEPQLFPVDERCTVVVVLDQDLYFTGNLLNIVGGDYMSEIDALSPAEAQHGVDSFHSFAFERLAWIGFDLGHLTPLHLIVTDRCPQPDRLISNALVSQLMHATAIFSANRSEFTVKRDYESVYVGQEHSAHVKLKLISATDETWKEIVRTIRWLQSADEAMARLIVFQNVVANELHDFAPEMAYDLFQSRLGYLLGKARWNFGMYVTIPSPKWLQKGSQRVR